MGIISKLGHWLDTRFPERISVEEVWKSLQAYEGLSIQLQEMAVLKQRITAFEEGARAFAKEISEMKDELNKIKATMAIMNRLRTSSPLPTSEAWKR